MRGEAKEEEKRVNWERGNPNDRQADRGRDRTIQTKFGRQTN